MVTVKQLFEAGAHFGHLRRFWNPKMAPYLYTSHRKVDIIDLDITIEAIASVEKMLRARASDLSKQRLLFVGTKRAVRDLIQREAVRCGMPYVNHRWLGGTLTNWKTVRSSISRLEALEAQVAKRSDGMTKKERLVCERKISSLKLSFEGLRDSGGLPDMLFVVDVHREKIAILEARKMGIPIIGVVDTNSDPEGIDYIIPMNDDSHRALGLVVKVVADAAMGVGESAASSPS